MERTELLTVWPDVWQAWAINFCKKNYWRVQHSVGDFDDCLAECALVWVICRKQYGSTSSPAEFMALYKKSVYTHFCDLSNTDTQIRAVAIPLESGADTAVDFEAEMDLQISLASLSGEVKDVLRVLISAPDEIISALRATAGTKPVSMLKHIAKYCGFSDLRANVICKELRSTLTK